MGKPVVLVVMDGVGWTDKDKGNAVLHSYKPQIEELMTKWPHTTIKAHGTAVGLPSDADMGNSEVGHLNIGAGRIVYPSKAARSTNPKHGRKLLRTQRNMTEKCISSACFPTATYIPTSLICSLC